MWHKKRVAGVIVSLALIAVLLLPMQAQAIAPVGFCRYFGELFVNGAHPTTPQVVSAWIKGVKVAEVTSGSIPGQNVWEYFLTVPSDDPDTPLVVEGGVNGDALVFKIAGVTATPPTQWIWMGFMRIDPTVTLPTRLEGDVNNDTQINLVDAVRVARHLVGTITLTGDDFLAADVNDDGFVNLLDLVLIKRFLVGTITQFPGGTYIP